MEFRETTVESVVLMQQTFWSNKRVLITGHTGFKGSWLSNCLLEQGADLLGYALSSSHHANLYHMTGLQNRIESQHGDIRDALRLQSVIARFQPEIIFHLAAQPLVRASYLDPIDTFSTNVMGTVNILEIARGVESVKVIVNITSDKCYENKSEQQRSFVESDPMGGYDPYSASKGCAELVTTSYARSFFSNSKKFLASARAGNVIGGGDWSNDRIIPDFIRSIIHQESLNIRQPEAVRPWQHVLDCLNGYMLLAEKLWTEQEDFIGAWNFGPSSKAFKTVKQLIECSRQYTDRLVDVQYSNNIDQPYEAKFLVLDSQKAIQQLGWHTKLDFTDAVQWTMDWYMAYLDGIDMSQFTVEQIKRFNNL